MKERKRQGQRNRWIRCLALAALILLFCEQVAARHLPPGHKFFVEDPDTFWALSPGERFDATVCDTVQINSLGLRGPEPDGRHPAVLLLGDSCVYGVGVPEGQTLDCWLAKELTTASARPVSVYNAGVSGYSTYQALKTLQRVGPVIRPEALIVACYYADRSPDLKPDSQRAVGEPVASLRRLLWPSHIYQILRLSVLEMKGEGTLIKAHDPVTASQALAQGQVPRVSLTEYRQNLASFLDLGRKFGVKRCFYVLLPDRDLSPNQQLPTTGLGQVVLASSSEQQCPPNVEPYQWYLTHPSLDGGCGVDLFSLWYKRKQNTEGLFSDNMHPTGSGNALIAKDLVPVMLQYSDWDAVTSR